jgi:predicted nucleic acid-binding protein
VILVDTSVWIGHLRARDDELSSLLESGQVLGHPFITGEIALGNLRHRSAILRELHELPQAIVASDEEVLQLIDRAALFGCGIGYVDAHLIAAVRLTAGATLSTRDSRLHAVAIELALATGQLH